MTEYNEPAKLGAKSCEFCKLVNVEAPFRPNDAVIIATHQYGLFPIYAMLINSKPGMICAIEMEKY